MIYADNAATTKVSDSVLEKMLPFLQEQYGNPSSTYSFGVKARNAIEQAREHISSAIGAAPDEITFTSCGSEANTWVLRGFVETSCNEESLHIITSSIEHPSVLNACRSLESRGIEVTYLPVDTKGHVSLYDFLTAIKPNTKFVSIMLANNEIGTIQPIAKLGKELRDRGILFHTDAVQAVGYIPVNVNGLHVDFLTASAHKYHGVKGTGFLYKRSGLELPPLVVGGGQEKGLRSGTENVAGIVAAGNALKESISTMPDTSKRLKAMIDATVEGIRARLPNIRVNGDSEERLPGIVNLGFDGVSAESLMQLLDLKGICVSAGSACASGKGEPSHVLSALGLSKEQAVSAIRISYSRYNTMDEVTAIVNGVCDSYDKIVMALR